MGKTTGLGDNLYVGGYNLSGDIGSLSKISGPQKTIEITGIDKLAYERAGGQRDGFISFNAYFNASVGQAHPVLSALPTADVVASYFRGTAIGNATASVVGKQINYNGKRTNDGALILDVDVEANSFGLEWGEQLTAGRRTDSSATNGTSWDYLAPTSFGWQAYLHVFAFTGTDVTVTIEDSANNIAFAGFTGSAFTQITTAPTTQRLVGAANATVRQYVRAVTSTSAGFSSLTFAVMFVKNSVSVVF
jgi:hypothetical protein